MNLRMLCRLLGRLALLLAAAMASCALAGGLWLSEGDNEPVVALALSSGVAATVALLLLLFGRHAGELILRKEAVAVVGLGWLMAAALGALPYILSEPGLSWPRAFFESASGFTTTGSSTIPHLGEWPHEILLWRATTQWLGGGGILVLFVALLSGLGVGGRSLMAYETSAQVSPGVEARIQDTALRLWQIYAGLTLICVVGLLVMGASLYEAICYAFAAISTGGFAPYDTSAAHFRSPATQFWLIIFMVLGGCNFLLFAWALRGRGDKLRNDEELRLYLAVIGISSLLVWLSLELGGGGRPPTDKGLLIPGLDALFQVVSVLTTTGFATADYLLWPPAAQAVLLLLFFGGGCTGSTAGSIKMLRWLVLAKSLRAQVLRSFRPQLVLPVRINGRALREDEQQTALSYVAFSLLVLLASIPIIACLEPDLDLATIASAVLTCFANVGPGFGQIGPAGNFSCFGNTTHFLLAVIMIVGRLEMYALLALLLPSLWKKF